MPRFIVEQLIPQAAQLSAIELQHVAQQAGRVARRLGPELQWVLTYVTAGKLYAVFIASDESLIHEHARESGLPLGAITAIKSIVDPATGEDV